MAYPRVIIYDPRLNEKKQLGLGDTKRNQGNCEVNNTMNGSTFNSN